MFGKRIFVIVLLLGALALVACGGAPGAEPGAAPGEATETPEAVQVAEEALGPARAALADFLGVDEDALEMERIEDAEWSDGCLGLGGPDESCLAAITPGYAITFNVGGESYVVRTDLEGNAVRVEAAAEQAPGESEGDAPEAALAALEQLALEAGVSAEEIEIVTWSAEEWSDSCLGLGGPEESCLQAITPGYLVLLRAGEKEFSVRTDASGDVVRIAGPETDRPGSKPPDPDLGDAVLFYERSGGIAGEIVTVRVYADGTVERSDRVDAQSDAIEAYAVEPAAVEQLLADLEEVGYFELERDYLPKDLCCDRILHLISARADGEVQTVEALGSTEDTPEAVWESVEIIESFVEGAMGQAQ